MAYIEARQFTTNRTWRNSDIPDKLQLIKRVWEAGMSAKQIAAAISTLTNTKVTRNAVIGIYTRHGEALKAQYLNMVTGAARAAHLNRRGKPTKASNKPGPLRVKADSMFLPRLKPPMPILYLYADAPESSGKRFVDLERFECKWETSNADKPADFRFCGNHAPHGPWCEFHAGRATGRMIESIAAMKPKA